MLKDSAKGIPIDAYCKNFQQLNSQLSQMKHFQEVSKSNLQAVQIRLVCFLEMFLV